VNSLIVGIIAGAVGMGYFISHGLLAASTIEREVSMRMIPIGAQGSFAIVVSPEHLANQFKDATLPPVLATPVMIMAMENAALNAIKPYFEAGESAVGTRVDVSHVAATPVGRRVVALAEVTNVAGRQVDFRVRALDGSEEIGRGTHGRVVIDLAKFSAHLASKSAIKPT
jgi:fluoroacetyl-CoA thioesterase